MHLLVSRRQSTRFFLFTPLVAALALSACGGGSDIVAGPAVPGANGTTLPIPVTPPTAPTPPAPPTPPTPPTTPPTAPTPPTPPINPITSVNLASGTVTSNSADMPAFSPAESSTGSPKAFTTVVSAASELYTFNSGNSGVDSAGTTIGRPMISYVFSTFGGELKTVNFLETRFERGVARRISRVCGNPCVGLTATKTASGAGIVISLQNVTLNLDTLQTNIPGASTAPVTINGSLTGEIENGYVYASQLPRSSSGTLAVNGAGEPAVQTIRSSQVTYPGGDAQLFPNIVMTTSAGTLSVRRNRPGSAPLEFSVVYQPNDPNKPLYFANVAGGVYTENANDYTVTLNNLTLNSNGRPAAQLTVNNNLTVGKPAGSLAIAGDTNFQPVTNIVGASNDILIYDFRSDLPAGVSVLPSVLAQVRFGVVQSLLITSNTGKRYTCGTEANNPFVAQCSGGFTLSADGRTLTFKDFKTGQTTNGNVSPVLLNGTLVSTGL